jgi:hypothetical protein
MGSDLKSDHVARSVGAPAAGKIYVTSDNWNAVRARTAAFIPRVSNAVDTHDVIISSLQAVYIKNRKA